MRVLLDSCKLPQMWAEPSYSCGNQTPTTLWKGYSVWIMMAAARIQRIPPENLQIVVHSDLDRRSNATAAKQQLNPYVSAVANGHADFVPLDMVFTHARYQHVDFRYAVMTLEVMFPLII